MRDTNGTLPDTAFWAAYGGKSYGVLQWAAFDRLIETLAASGGAWYVFDPEGEAPEAPLEGAEFATVLDAARGMMEEVRNRSFCGVAFADDLEAPGFVKIFDPWKMGGVCGGSGTRVMPWRTLSRIKPDALPLLPEPPEKKGMLARLRG